jgi:hypothetical protein
MQPELQETGVKFTCLEIDVPTRWNSTWAMFNRAIQLRRSCTHVCEEKAETRPYLLSTAEWDQAANIMNLLEPLSEATELLCKSKYPTLNTALPVYVLLMKHLKRVQRGLYDQAQLIQPATKIINKIDQYFCAALNKPIYVCAMILNPTSKTNLWKKNNSFLKASYNKSVDNIIETFCEVANEFKIEKSTPNPTPSTTTSVSSSKQKPTSLFLAELYEPISVLDTIEAEVDRYLKEDLEPEKTDILQYWANRQNTFPTLSAMARRYLAVPATSAASKRVFSKGQQIVSWKHSSLEPETIEGLLCLKEWYQLLDSPL